MAYYRIVAPYFVMTLKFEDYVSVILIISISMNDHNFFLLWYDYHVIVYDYCGKINKYQTCEKCFQLA